MKKAFAVMTTMLVALACFGFLTKAQVNAAESKIFTEDPTLAEDEIPMYIMDSIYSTFPNYYNNEELPDEKWQGSSRMYPWNELKLRIAQYENGQPTGKYYAVYFTGALTHMSGNDQVPGAGKNILVYELDAEGKVQLSRYDQGTKYANRNAADPSLSHMNTNISGQDLYFNMQEAFKKVGDGADDGRMYLASLVFDGQGRAIRGSVGNSVFLEPGTEGAAANLMAPLFCYVDGKVVKYVEGETIPDKKMEAKVDPETGEVILDEEGNPEMVETDKPAMLYKRFTWAWFEKDAEGNLPEHVKINTVGYLEEGWDKDAWDYAWEQDGGMMCIAFMGTDGSEELLDADMLAAYNRDQKAAWTGEGEYVDAAAGTVSRNVITHFYVPAGGYTYDLGYLDRGTALYPIYHTIFLNSFAYGRAENYSAQRTVNFSAGGLMAQDYASEGTGLRLMENNVIEVMPGTVIKPGSNVVYTGLTRYWDKGEDGQSNDVTKFISSDSTCEFYIKVNGSTVVMPNLYASFDDLVTDFMKDMNAWRKSLLSEADQATYVDVPAPTQAEANGSSSKFYTTFNNYFCSFYGDANSFIAQPQYNAKWRWVYEYVAQQTGSGVTFDFNTNKASSPGQWTCSMAGFLSQAPKGSGWPCNKGDFTNAATDLLYPSWGEYAIDTTGAELDTAYEVEYRVVNAATENESSISITYVVTDVYTPIIEVNEAALNVSNELVDGALVINGGQPITAAQLLTAYNGKYTELTNTLAQNLKGRDITYKVTMESDTLDFNNPTEGSHLVTARVAASATKQAVAQFTVVIRDRTAPEVEVVSETVNIAYGSTFDASVGIVSAYDKVDGNLKLAPFSWCVDLSDTPVNTTKPGQYTVKVSVYDKAGNHTDVSYKVVVAAAYASNDAVKDLGDLLEEVGILVEEAKEAINGVINQVTAVNTKLDSQKGGCAKSSGALAVSILSAASLLVVVLRKKH